VTFDEKSSLVDSSTMNCAVGSETAVQLTVYSEPDCVTGGALTVGVHVGASTLTNAYAEPNSSPSSLPTHVTPRSAAHAVRVR
jgi:hypothetical protein